MFVSADFFVWGWHEIRARTNRGRMNTCVIFLIDIGFKIYSCFLIHSAGDSKSSAEFRQNFSSIIIADIAGTFRFFKSAMFVPEMTS